MQAPDANIRFFEEDDDFSEIKRMHEGLMEIQRDELEDTVNMNRTQRKGWMKNKPCICGSGKKFKKCCWNNYT